MYTLFLYYLLMLLLLGSRGLRRLALPHRLNISNTIYLPSNTNNNNSNNGNIHKHSDDNHVNTNSNNNVYNNLGSVLIIQ